MSQLKNRPHCEVKCLKCGKVFSFSLCLDELDYLLCSCGNRQPVIYHCKKCGRGIHLKGKRRYKLVDKKCYDMSYTCEHCGFRDGHISF